MTTQRRILHALTLLTLVPQSSRGGKKTNTGGLQCFQDGDELRETLQHYWLGAEEYVVSTYGKVEDWCVSKVQNFDNLCTPSHDFPPSYYEKVDNFNEPLTNWDTSSAVSMVNMFYGCGRFNQPLDHFDVKKVKVFTGMFQGLEKFNQPLDSWNTKSAKLMDAMFINAEAFNQNVDHFKIGRVQSMWAMFWGAEKFNQDVCAWQQQIAKGTVVKDMFGETSCPEEEDPVMSKKKKNGAYSAGPLCHACSAAAATGNEIDCEGEVLSQCTCEDVAGAKKCAKKLLKKLCPDLSGKAVKKIFKKQKKFIASEC